MESLGYISIAVSSLTLIVLVIEKVFGGGNALAAKFARLDKDTSERVAAMERQLNTKVDEYEDNYAVGLDSIKSSIHAMQLALLEFRAKMAEDYMHKQDHSLWVADVRRELHEGFAQVEKRLERMETNMSSR